jgi:hypothetical protein
MDLALLGFDHLNEAVAPSLGLGARTTRQAFPQKPTLVDRKGTYGKVSHDIFARSRADLVQLF